MKSALIGVFVWENGVCSRVSVRDPSDAGAEVKLRQYVGACRAVYNTALEQRITAYETLGVSVSYKSQASDLKELRDDPEVAPWLQDIPSQILQQSLKDISSAYSNFFELGVVTLVIMVNTQVRTVFVFPRA